MNNCGTCQFSEIRPEGIGLCHNQDAKKYAEEVDYHHADCEQFEPLSEMFNLEGGLWD